MSRRFSDEPINLIHRIPTPEQLASARPAKRSFGQAIVEAAASYVRAAADTITRVTRVDRTTQVTAGTDSAAEDRLEECAGEPTPENLASPGTGAKASPGVGEPIETVTDPFSREDFNPPPSVSISAVVQPEEMAELRAYLLSQQQDIARLSAQIQELKSLVVSQQQVLVHLGKELEAGTLSPLMGGIASAAPKRSRPVRRKPITKDKAVAQQEDQNRSSLGLWPASPRRPDL
ncbi:MAG: hypothetical protein ACT4O4_10395 [Nitrospiraceae bacterium]